MSNTINEITLLKEQATYNKSFAKSQNEFNKANDSLKYLNIALNVLNNKKESTVNILLSTAFLRQTYNESNKDLFYHEVRNLKTSVEVIKRKRMALNQTIRLMDKIS